MLPPIEYMIAAMLALYFLYALLPQQAEGEYP